MSSVIALLLLSSIGYAVEPELAPFILGTDTVTGTALQPLGVALGHPEVSTNAAFDLARHPDPAAGRMLVAALPKYSMNSSTSVVMPLLQAIGDRGDPALTNSVVPYLGHPDAVVAETAGWAVLRLERHRALPLLKPLTRRPDSTRFSPLLRESELLFAEEAIRIRSTAAERVYRGLFAKDRTTAERLTGLRGLGLSLGEKAPGFLIQALADDDAKVRNASARLLEALPEPAGRIMAAELPKSPDGIAILLLEVLANRREPAGRPAARTGARAQSAEVRIAAFKALAALGDESDVMILAGAAATAAGDEAAAARDALRELPAASADARIVAALATPGDPAPFVELIRAAAARRSPGAAVALRPLLASTRYEIASAAAEALGTIGTSDDYAPVLDALINSPDAESLRTAQEKALVALVNRLDDRTKTAPPVLGALTTARPALRPSLLRLLAAIGGDDARKAVFKAVSTEATRDPAVRALAAWKDPSPASDLLALVPVLPAGSLPVVALRGAIRLAGLDGDLKPADRLALLDRALALASRDEERKAAISALGKLDTPAAWDRIKPFMRKPGFEAEAAGAAAALASNIRGSDAAVSREAATAALAAATSDEVRKTARKTLTALDAGSEWLGAWVVSKAFELDHGTPEKLHATAFPPETNPALTDWTRIDQPGSGKHPYTLPLGDAVGGENRVAYLRTRIYSPKSMKASLEIGADDGLKAWLNEKEVKDDFALRAMEPGELKVPVELRKGWNDLMLKITQGEGDWEACARLRTPDGAPIPGLKSERP